MVEMRATFKFLCYTHQACPDVKAGLKDMGFRKVRDAPYHSTYDIYAKMDLIDREHENDVLDEIWERFGDEVHSIEITTR